jgi:hypothetical protein
MKFFFKIEYLEEAPGDFLLNLRFDIKSGIE